MLGISIHAPTRGATLAAEASDATPRISIHAPTRGATVVVLPLVLNVFLFQSTLPREERQILEGIEISYAEISIHAPTRGATEGFLDDLNKIQFQSTLPREERPDVADIEEQLRNFNPRSHERSDPADSYQIHYCQHFNPRSHERSDVTR